MINSNRLQALHSEVQSMHLSKVIKSKLNFFFFPLMFLFDLRQSFIK